MNTKDLIRRWQWVRSHCRDYSGRGPGDWQVVLKVPGFSNAPSWRHESLGCDLIVNVVMIAATVLVQGWRVPVWQRDSHTFRAPPRPAESMMSTRRYCAPKSHTVSTSDETVTGEGRWHLLLCLLPRDSNSCLRDLRAIGRGEPKQCHEIPEPSTKSKRLSESTVCMRVKCWRREWDSISAI